VRRAAFVRADAERGQLAKLVRIEQTRREPGGVQETPEVVARVRERRLRVLKRKIRQLAGRVLGHPQRPALDRTAEAGLGVRLGGQERMFSWQFH